MDMLLITDKEALIPYEAQILSLFQRSFDQSLAPRLWRWAYIDNPCGEPVVSLCVEDKRVLGHYAVIPFTLFEHETPIKTVLSMTTMVDPSMRGQGLFTKQAQHVYEHLEQAGYDYVYGFPNQNSLPGFRKHLQWTIDENAYVAKVNKVQLADSTDLLEYFAKPSYYQIELNHKAFRKWRFEKPGYHYQRHGETVLKPYKGEHDIVLLGDDFVDCLDATQDYHVLLDGSIKDLIDYKVFDYPVGYRAFQGRAAPNFKLDLLMSDVF